MGTLVGLFETRDQAQRAAAALREAGFNANDISVVMKHRADAATVATGAGLNNEVSAAGAGAVGGTVLGGAAGLALGLGLLTVPGLGPLLAAGPIVAAVTGAGVGAAAGGLLGALTDLGVPAGDAPIYQEGVERGGVLVTVKAPDGREAEAHAILEREGLRHLDEHRKLWNSDPGYRYHTGAETEVDTSDTGRTASATETHRRTEMSSKKTTTEHETVDRARVDAKAGGTAVGGTAGALIGAAVGGPIGAGVGAVAGSALGGAAGAAVDDRDYAAVEPEFRHDWERGPYKASTSWDDASTAYRHGWESHTRPEHQGRSWDEVKPHLEKSWSGKGAFKDYEPLARSGWERRAASRVESGGEAVVPVIEEEAHVAKRAVSKGGVRVETKVTERPVEAQVNLHEEKVHVERRPVNRAASGADADAAFQEGTIEVKETAEEAVINKSARVVEEVVINKTGHDRTETVRDTVRKTDVEVKQVDTPITETREVSETEIKGRGKKA